MDNKLNNMLNEFFENTDAKNEDELNKKLEEFMKKYNSGEIKYENTILDDAYELLEKASHTKSKKQAMKLAKEAYNMCPGCFDAILLQVELEDDVLKRDTILDEGLEREKERLEEEGYFEKENIGHFYGIFETRPYIRGLNLKAMNLANYGKIKFARDMCKEILRLNNNDNMGARYLLMALYAYLEDEKEMLKLYKKYPEENLEMLFPLFALYYKLDDTKKAKDYLQKINRCNSHFVKLFKGNLEADEDVLEGYYQPGGVSEVHMYFQTFAFLIFTMPTLNHFVLANLKIKK